MRIKKIEVEGFKSYAQRQTVERLDAQFNAITGLNGSGKSNILDAICFLLGLTNLQQVRAHNLTDLVYKQGQGGINRATVTITFDNDVPADKQPYGMEKFKEIVVRRQIIINGKNTYQINGATATNQRVIDLFRSVGINVNNPHFLIMQGRITKVLNMKPMEILAMVEEAAGVRMYESKKESCLRMIDKKENKVQEITRLLDEDIIPRVEKLKRDKADYLEYQRIEKELEELGRKLIAFDFFSTLGQTDELKLEEKKKRNEIQQIKNEIVELKETYQTEKKSYEEMDKTRVEKNAEERERLEAAVSEVHTEEAQIDSEREGQDSKMKELRVGIERKQKSVNSDKKELTKKEAELASKESDIGEEERRYKAAEDTEIRARQKLEALAMGMITDDEGNAISLDAKLTDARSKLSEVQTSCQAAEMKINSLVPTMDKKKVELKAVAGKSGNQQTAKAKLEKDKLEFERQIGGMRFDEGLEQQLHGERRQLGAEKNGLMNEIDQFEARNHNLQFSYRDPYENFDRTKVKGLVANLFKVRDMRFATALEVAAGGKLHNVVVDAAETAKLLLDKTKNCLKKRVTLLPLDKMETRGLLGKAQLDEARRLVGREKVFLAKELVQCEPYLEPIMDFVFGSVLLCETSDQAKQLAFSRGVSCRTVTVDGDDFNPGGTLTGGSRPPTEPILQQLDAISASYKRRTEIDGRLKWIENELRRVEPVRRQYDQLQTQLAECGKNLENLNANLANSPAELLRNEIQTIEEEIGKCRQRIDESRPQILELSEKVKTMEQQKKNEKNFQEQEKKKAEKELKTAQTELASLKDTFANIREMLPGLREDINSLKQTIRDDSDQIEQMKRELEDAEAGIQRFKGAVEEVKNKVRDAQARLEEYNKKIRAEDKALRDKGAKLEAINKQAKKLEAKQESSERDLEELGKGFRESKKRVEQLKKSHTWIVEEEAQFGVQGTLYDFTSYTYEVGRREISQRKDRSKVLLQTVNPKAMSLLNTAEQKCEELKQKREQLVKDKQQLFETIDQLDEKKKRELVIAHKQINIDFGAIYSTLLPGANAELVPPAGKASCLDGLEFRIAFSGKVKESLMELSGGQRSLVALSLILAMLKFKPAPFYILDEVDAALDLSHTEHIGKVIKNHFKESQFIVVSLKDGFFNNANVLYKTKFIDGTSTVTRIQNTKN